MFGSTAWDLVSEVGPKILAAIFCGGLVGLERELKQKHAGLKTNILICVGSALFSVLSVYIADTQKALGVHADPARLAAQVVSGIGFLGGGAIIQSRGNIHGLTTAATIWLVAAIGVSIGFGHIGLAMAISAIVVGVLVGTTQFEVRFMGRGQIVESEIVATEEHGNIIRHVHEALDEHDLVLDDVRIHRESGKSVIRVRYHGLARARKKFILDIWGHPAVREVREI